MEHLSSTVQRIHQYNIGLNTGWNQRLKCNSREPSSIMLLLSLPLSHLSSGCWELSQHSNSMHPSVPFSPCPVRRMTLSGTAVKSAKSNCDGSGKSDAGTARMSLGSFEEYVCKSTCGLGKNSKCLLKSLSITQIVSLDQLTWIVMQMPQLPLCRHPPHAYTYCYTLQRPPLQHPPCSLYHQAIPSCFIQKWASHGLCGREGRPETWDGWRTNAGRAIQAIWGRMCLYHREAGRTAMRESWWWYLDTQLTKGKLMSKRIIPISITSQSFQWLCKAPWGLRLGCEFVYLTDCETTW